MPNVIKQIVKAGQTIKMIVRSNERGPAGTPGEQGEAATVSAGEAYQVPITQQPSVINTGTPQDAVFDFYIPTGAKWGGIVGDISDQADLRQYLNKIDSAVQPEDIDYTVEKDTELSSNESTVDMTLETVHLSTGDTGTRTVPFPVASRTQAGVMNASTYAGIEEDHEKIEAILGGSVSLNNLPASPTQEQLTEAWKTATGRANLINTARILDVTNEKEWTYYSNSDRWFSAATGATVTINTFTNTSEGTILGSEAEGRIHAEVDKTGSVNGWDALKGRVTDTENDKLATANLLTDSTISRTVAGSGASETVTLGLADNAVTSAKIANNAVTTAKIGDGQVTGAKIEAGTIYGSPNDATTVGTGRLALNTVGTPNLRDSAVSAGKLANNAVTTAKIGDLNVTTGKLANGAVTGVANNATAIGSAKLALNTVGTPNLRNAAVTSGKIDWTTLGFTRKEDAGTTYDLTTGWSNVTTLGTLQAGTYLVFIQSLLSQFQTASRTVWISASSGSVRSSEIIAQVERQNVLPWSLVSGVMRLTLSSAGSVTIQARADVAVQVTSALFNAFAVRVA